MHFSSEFHKPLLKMFSCISIKFRSDLKPHLTWSNIHSQCQILAKTCVPIRGLIFDMIFLKLVKKVVSIKSEMDLTRSEKARLYISCGSSATVFSTSFRKSFFA